jgi:hypothetical protein
MHMFTHIRSPPGYFMSIIKLKRLPKGDLIGFVTPASPAAPWLSLALGVEEIIVKQTQRRVSGED